MTWTLPYTLLLGTVLIYWFTVMFGVLDLSSLDMDLPDADADVGGAEGVHPGFDALLEYFNIRHVPVSIVVSFFSLSLWVVGVLANHALHDTSSLLLGALVFAANLVFSGHVAKWVTAPLVPLFKAMRKDAESVTDLSGRRVVVTSSRDDKLARLRELGADVTVNYRTEPEWGKRVAAQTGGVDVVLENVPEGQSLAVFRLRNLVLLKNTGTRPLLARGRQLQPGEFSRLYQGQRVVLDESVFEFQDLVTYLNAKKGFTSWIRK
jgi:hypothetical protein